MMKLQMIQVNDSISIYKNGHIFNDVALLNRYLQNDMNDIESKIINENLILLVSNS